VSARTDVLLLSLGTTLGWRVADRLLADGIEAAGASVAAVGVGFGRAGRLRRGYPLNDAVEALAARRALRAALRRHEPRAVIACTTTAALLAPRAGVPLAVRLDAPAAINRPGAHNAGVRALERRSLARADLVLPWSRAAREALPPGSARAVVLPPPLPWSPPGPHERERLAIAYVPDPRAKGLDVVCAGWLSADVPGARLAVFGVDPAAGRTYLAARGIAQDPSVEWRGQVPVADFRAALRRAHAYVGGARWEDYGQAPLEALSDGALLATAPSPGPFEALRLARRLDPSLVAAGFSPRELGDAVRAAFALGGEEAAGYRERAAGLLEPYRPAAVQALVERELLPALLR
jgi:hypothetical protein